MGNHIKGFAIAKLCNIHSSSLDPRVSYPITKGNQVSGAGFLYGNSILAIPNHHLALHNSGSGFQQYLLHTCPSKVRLTSLQYPRSSLPLLNMGVMFALFFFFFPGHQETPLIAICPSKLIESGLTHWHKQCFQHPWMCPMRTNGVVCVQWLKHTSTVDTTSLS